MTLRTLRSQRRSDGGQDGSPSLSDRMRQMQAAPGAITSDEDTITIPIVAIREGVFQCANCPTPELYLAENFGRIVDSWNDRAVTIGHPEQNGFFISAGNEGMWDAYGIGRVKNARVEDKKLKVDAVIDKAKVEDLGSLAVDLIARIEKGEEIDVSIGAFVDAVPKLGVHTDGKPYAAVQTNYVPDHIAILPVGVKGACSWADGCGAPRVNYGCGCGGAGGVCQCDGAGGLADAQLSARTKRQVLQGALIEKEQEWVWILELFDDFVVYELEDERGIFRRDYTIDEESGTVSLSEDREAGVLTQDWMPITVQQQEVLDMNRKKAVDRLIASSSTEWTEDDRGALMAMSAGSFARFAPSEDTTQGSEGEGDGGDGAVTAAPASDANDSVTTETAGDGADAVTETTTAPEVSQEARVQAWMDSAPPGFGEVVKDALVERKATRAAMIQQIQANASNQFSPEALSAMDTDTLKQIAALAGPSDDHPGGSQYGALFRDDFSGAAPAASAAAPDGGFLAPPAAPDYTKAN